LDIPRHFPQVTLDAFVVMPDHVHGIVMMGRKDVSGAVSTIPPARSIPQSQPNDDGVQSRNVETQNFASLRQPSQKPPPHNHFGAQSRNLASVIRGFKIGVTVAVRAIHPDFIWQHRFHDRIIRNAQEMDAYRRYIMQNPANWPGDPL
jgi:REP element-mobilizing transposase RayT